MRLPGSALLLAAAISSVAGACGGGESGGNGDGYTEADAEKWATRHAKQVVRWRDDANRTEPALKRGDFEAAGRIVKKIGREGDRVRLRFRKVPTNLRHGDRLYSMIVDAGDAASQWALIFRTDPPPYPQTARGLRKSQRIADAAVAFEQKTNRILRFLREHEDEPLTR